MQCNRLPVGPRHLLAMHSVIGLQYKRCVSVCVRLPATVPAEVLTGQTVNIGCVIA